MCTFCSKYREIFSALSFVPRTPGFSIKGGVTKCSADVALRMIQLGATIVHVSEAVNEAEAEAIARAIELSNTLVRFTVTGTVPPVGVARIAAAALTVRGLTFVQLPGERACLTEAGTRVAGLI